MKKKFKKQISLYKQASAIVSFVVHDPGSQRDGRGRVCARIEETIGLGRGIREGGILGLKAVATCSADDTWNQKTGYEIARDRIVIKALDNMRRQALRHHDQILALEQQLAEKYT